MFQDARVTSTKALSIVGGAFFFDRHRCVDRILRSEQKNGASVPEFSDDKDPNQCGDRDK